MPAQTFESDEARLIRAYTLELEGPTPMSLTLPLNPQQFTMTEPSRNVVQHTLGGHYVEEWGAGLPVISLEGHTGYAEKTIVDGMPPMDGYAAFQALVKLLRVYHADTKKNATTRTSAYQGAKLKLHVWEEDEHWLVVPTGQDALRRSRSAQSPLLFNYTLSLTALEDLKHGQELATDLFGVKDPWGWGAAITETLNEMGKNITDWAKIATLPGGMTVMEAFEKVRDTAQAVLKFTKEAGRSAEAAVKALMAPVRAAAKLCRDMQTAIAGSLASLGRAAGAARRASNELLHMACIFTNFHAFWNRFTSSMGNALLSNFHAAGRREMRC